jgi:elongation factor G
MKNVRVQDVRTVALCGHSSSGKTSLVDAMLVKCGAISIPASVDAGTSICDFDPEEKSHHHTIETKVVHFLHGGKRYQILDTPGYGDFLAQTIEAFRGADSAAIVINAHNGIEVNCRRVFQEAQKEHLGIMIIVNKMDTDNLNVQELMDDIHQTWGNRCIPLNLPEGKEKDFHGVVSMLDPHDAPDTPFKPQDIHNVLVEAIVETDEAVMEKYLEGETPSKEKILELLPLAVAKGALIPVVFCSARTGVGICEMVEMIGAAMPSPCDIQRHAIRDGATVDVVTDPNGPLVAQVFKTRIDPFVQKLSFVRIFSGTLKKDMQVHCSGQKKNIKLGTIYEVRGSETHAVDEASAGDIVAVAKQEELHTASTLGDYDMPPISFPKPMVGIAIRAKNHGDETKLASALHKIVEEDPTIRLDRDPQTKELVMTGMSELHLQLVRERLARRDHIEVDTKPPKIPYRETIQAPAEGMYRHKKQSGGRGQFGEVHIRMYPLPPQTEVKDFVSDKKRFPHLKNFHYDEENNFLWVDSIVGGTIPGNFMPAIEKGFKERIDRGVIAGYRIKDIAIEVHFGKYHDVDSSEAAFKTAASMAFRNVFKDAKPGLLEPIVKLSVTVPEQHVGDIYGDISSRGGRVSGTESAGGDYQTVIAEVPLRSLDHYARTVSSVTGGLGSFTMELSHYEVMPALAQREVLASATVGEEEEE